MAKWFECKFKFSREDESGGYKSITETYLVDAVSFTEAESRVYSEVASNLRDFLLLKIAPYPIHDMVISDQGAKFYKCKVVMLTVDEKSGREKKVNQFVLVNADCIDKANEVIDDLYSTALSNFTSVSISETNIVEVLPYTENTNETQTTNN